VEQGAGSREQGAGSREQGAGSREQGAGSREQGAGSREQGAPDPQSEKRVRWFRTVGRAYQRLHPRLISFAESRVSCPATAEDLVQEVYLRGPTIVPEELCEPENVDRLFRYLCGCLRRFLADRRKVQRIRAGLEPELQAAFPGSDRPARFWHARLTCQQLLSRLSPQDAKLLRHRFLEGKPPAEISKVLGVSPGTGRTRIHRAVSRARRLLAADQ
jgi:RNA polymerase sigma factor (sigma-70 family)